MKHKYSYYLGLLAFFMLFVNAKTTFAGNYNKNIGFNPIVKNSKTLKSPNTIGNFTYTVTPKNEECAGDGSITISTTADAGTTIKATITGNGISRNETITSTGNDDISFETLNVGDYEVSFTITKDGQPETINAGTFNVGSDRDDIYTENVRYDPNYAYTCDDGIQRISVNLRSGKIKDYKVVELDGTTEGNTVVDWTTPTDNPDPKHYSFDLTFSQVDNISTSRIRIISRDKCGTTSKADQKIEKKEFKLDFRYRMDNLQVYCDKIKFDVEIGEYV